MKRLSAALLALTLLLTACAGAPGGSSSTPASSGKAGVSSVGSTGDASEALSSAAGVSSDVTASDPSSEAAASSETATSAASSTASSGQTASLPTPVPGEAYDVDAAFAASGKSMTADVSFCFPADASGYVVNGGTADKPYLVDDATIVRLTKVPVTGTGYVKWKGFSKGANVSASTDPFDGVVPVSRLSDPIFMAACLPSEAATYMSYRVNAGNHYPVTDQQERILAIGAVYRNENDKPADNETLTICLSNFTLILHTAKKGWFVAEKTAVPAVSNVQQMYYLPWSLENAMGNYKIPSNQVSRKSDHVEVRLTGGSFNGAAFIDSNGMVTGRNGTKYPYDQIPTNSGGTGKLEELCHHYWGTTKYFSNLGVTGSEVDGVVVAYRAWVREDNMAGKLVATIGSDIKGSVDHQVFSGLNYALTTQPRWIIGHNVGPKAYGTILTPADSEQIQKLIGMK